MKKKSIVKDEPATQGYVKPNAPGYVRQEPLRRHPDRNNR